ncbi:beta-N-acetylhexosaminidase [Gilliamella sp. wkB108]|uniref:beta-N-acetylhexosaminidase n=1 Tax=Gilliamella sp. wkB108 TaxID=3120256 RepID=UPI00080DD2FB|nr:beta-N-acetylhexosaminidase [Gilliamella apicola]OCG24859.1 beta-N-acetylhexosaminidase [Gilliamella apicola]
MQKFKKTILTTAVTSLLGFGVAQSVNASQEVVDEISSQLQVNYKIVDNNANNNGVDCAALGADWASCNKVTISFKNKGSAIKSRDWAIYFDNIRMILKVNNDQFKITHITGDLHRLEPTEKFTGFEANQTTTIPIVGEYWQISQSDVMPRWYVTSSDAKAKVIANTDTDSDNLSAFVLPIGNQWKISLYDHNILMTPQNRFQHNADITMMDASLLRGQILPTPTKLTVGNEDITLGQQGVDLALNGLENESVEVLQNQFKQLNIPVGTEGFKIEGKIDKDNFDNGVNGAYKLNITQQGATIVGYDESGVFYGVQSILSLLSAKEPHKLATLTAEDQPRFEYRGIMLDTGRNFKTKQAVMQLLDTMSKYKMNKFHFHLSDDEGWRIEIPGLPELTTVGSQRCHDLNEQKCLLPQLGSGPDSNTNGSGYFTRNDYIEIVKYAKSRFIEVIPEIDMPAHARAAIMSMEARYNRLIAEGKSEEEASEYRLVDPTDTSNTTSVQFYNRQSYLNPCLDSSKKFANKIITEIAEMHKEAGQPISTWHFGGDEAKNIYFGNGYQDINASPKAEGKGLIDQSVEDHPWAKSQACQTFIKKGIVEDIEHLPSYFAVEVSKIIENSGINRMQAWQDGVKFAPSAKSFATKDVTVNFWDTLYWGGYDSASEWANKGYKVIISNPDYIYLDMPYEVNPNESGYYWAARFNDERKIFSFAPDNLPQNAETSFDRNGDEFEATGTMNWPGAYGLSAQIWTEDIRTDEKMAYMAFPRLLSVAERAWHKADWETDYKKGVKYKQGETHYVDQKKLLDDWNRFANLVGQRELSKLDLAKIDYRLPIPGAKLEKGKLIANIAFPGLTIEYSINGGKSWKQYKDPVAIKNRETVSIRSVSPNQKRASRVEQVK